MRPRHHASAAAVILAAVMIVAACSGEKQDSSGGSQASSQPDAGPPQSGGTFIWNAVVEAPTLDPHKSASAYTALSTSGTVYSKLLEFKTGGDVPYGTMEPQADLAQEWSHSGDASTWTFNLRKGVKWQNKAPVNGREFTSADVVCTLDRIKTLPGVQLSLVQLIDTVQTPDPYTVVIKLKTSFAAFDETVANYYLSILPCEGTRGEFDLANNPIGTGPFILDKWQKNVEKTYVRNPDYFIPGKPYLDEFHMVTINDPAASIAAYRAGELDAIPVSAQLLPSVLSSVEDSVQTKTWCVCNVHVVINQAVKPFDQLKVRRAVALALDREGMAQSLGSSDYKLTGPVPSLLFGGLPPDEAGELTPYDPTQARKLLTEAGYPNGFDVTLTTTDGYGPTVVTGAQWVQEDLKKIGINVTLRVLDYATWFTTWANEDYTIGYSASSAFLSADEWLSSYFLSNGSRNWFNINDPKLDQMINEQRGIIDRDERQEKLEDISRYIIENVSNPVMTYNGESTTVTRPWVHDWHPHPEYGPSWIKNVWVDSTSPR